MILEIVLSILSIVGIGGIIGAFFTYFWQKKKEILLRENELKEKRYLCILLLMYALINPEELMTLKEKRRDIKNLDDLKRELQAEWVNSWVFAGDNTIRMFKEFLEHPNGNNFANTILSMRKELWGNKSRLSPSMFSVLPFLK